jgi:hypothetical protein
MSKLAWMAAASCWLFACQGSPALPEPESPSLVGGGLIAVPAEAPPGTKTWDCPKWQLGDRFTMVRGEQMRGTFAVTAIEDGAYVIDMGNDRLVRRDQSLGNLGEWHAATGEARRVMSPVDVRYHWPLWVGKHWQCEFVDRVRDGQAVKMNATYDVEGLEQIAVPAGSFEVLRIRRTLRLVGAGEQFLTRTQMIWFAPDPGIEVRQLLGDTLIELAGFERAQLQR